MTRKCFGECEGKEREMVKKMGFSKSYDLHMGVTSGKLGNLQHSGIRYFFKTKNIFKISFLNNFFYKLVLRKKWNV